ACWGRSFVVQAASSHASWIGRTTPMTVVGAIGGFVTNGAPLVAAGAVVAGLVVLVRADRVLGRVVAATAGVPIAMAAVVELFVPFFVDRTLTVAAWAAPLAVGALAAAAVDHDRLLGAVTVVVVAVVVVPSSVLFLSRHWEYDATVDRLEQVARPGDVVAVVPAWSAPLLDWRVGVGGTVPARPVPVNGLPGAAAFALGATGAQARIWEVTFAGSRVRAPTAPACARPWSDGV